MEAEAAVIQAALLRDPVFNAYALADLQPRYAPACRWLVRRGSEEEETAVVLFYQGLEPPIVMATGPVTLIAQALAETADLPPALYMSVDKSVFAILQTYYDFGDDVRFMWRMVLDQSLDATRPPGSRSVVESIEKSTAEEGIEDFNGALQLVELSAGDAIRLRALYAHGGEFAPDSFDAYQLDDGIFFGIENARQELVAAGGTHVVDPDGGVAAIGNMYTHPQWRGRGLAKAVLSAIVGALQRQSLSLIVLNVDRRNIIARRFYKRFGFRLHCEFLEGIGVLRGIPEESIDVLDTQTNCKSIDCNRV